MKRYSDVELRWLNSVTKYPSIPTFHPMEKGRLGAEPWRNFAPGQRWHVTEKIDGTNARLIYTDGHWFIGSREELLTFETDVIRNPALGIVEELLPRISTPVLGERSCAALVVFGEVYGAGVNGGKSYSRAGQRHFRVFDVLDFSQEEWNKPRELPPEGIHMWREMGGQPWQSPEQVRQWCGELGFDHVPVLTSGEGPLPTDLQECGMWLRDTVGTETSAGLDAHGEPEGVIVRSADRKAVYKLRLEDYERTVPALRAYRGKEGSA